MPNSPTLRQVSTHTNLDRAWLRVRTSTDYAYKLYFRHIYNAVALISDDVLSDIRDRLRSGTFRPSASAKLFFPKATGILRPVTLLSVEDQIVYQAIGNVVGDRLITRVGSRYNRSVFGNLYAGKHSPFFYQDWRRSYPLYTGAMRRAFQSGYRWSASFDLTACYDTIDHAVLKQFLKAVGIDDETCDFLCMLLTHWTEVSGRPRPVYHGHGIPQGPVPSGILAECVLRHFDEARRPRGVKYFRYVDDIRLFARDEKALRLELVKLDMRSKEIGLFPQAGKILLHQVTNIDDEIKSISNPPEVGTGGRTPSQGVVRRRLTKLTPRLVVTNPTRFKFVLAQAKPQAALALRMLSVVRKQPSFYTPIFRHLESYRSLSPKVSKECVSLLRELDLYSAFTAALIRAIGKNIHPTQRPQLHRYCRSRLSNTRRDWNPELRAVAASCLIRDGVATWAQTSYNARWTKNWWTRTEVIQNVSVSHYGPGSVTALCNSLIRDQYFDVSVVAAGKMIEEGLPVSRPLRDVHPAGQQVLRAAGLVGRVSTRTCHINRIVVERLGPQLRSVEWRRVFFKRGHYKLMLPKFARWRGYYDTDPTAWVALTDTINDIILDALYKHDGTIGTYTIGQIGSTTGSPTSRFATKYPTVYQAVAEFHRLRLEADLSHSVTRSSNRATRAIRHNELPRLRRLLATAYFDIWASW